MQDATIKHIVCGSTLMFDPDGRVLLCGRKDDSGLFSRSTGKKKAGESALAAALREALEETGVRLEPEDVVEVYSSDWPADETPAGVKGHTTVFLVQRRIDPAEVQPGPGEAPAKWFPAEALRDPKVNAFVRFDTEMLQKVPSLIVVGSHAVVLSASSGVGASLVNPFRIACDIEGSEDVRRHGLSRIHLEEAATRVIEPYRTALAELQRERKELVSEAGQLRSEMDRWVWKGTAEPTRFPRICRGCGRPLLLENLFCDDGCPCNTPRGVNFMPQPCTLCRVDDCVRPGHRLEALFGLTDQSMPLREALAAQVEQHRVEANGLAAQCEEAIKERDQARTDEAYWKNRATHAEAQIRAFAEHERKAETIATGAAAVVSTEAAAYRVLADELHEVRAEGCGYAFALGQAEAVNQALRDRLKRQGRAIHWANEAQHRRAVEMDALHYVWCNGGCRNGVARFEDHPKPTAQVVETAIRNTQRLVVWFNSSEFRAAVEAMKVSDPDVLGTYWRWVDEAHAKRRAAEEQAEAARTEGCGYAFALGQAEATLGRHDAIFAGDAKPMVSQINMMAGCLELGMQGSWLTLLMAETFAQMLGSKEHAPNYIEQRIQHSEYGLITATIRREEGKTPHQMRQLAEAECDAALARVKELESGWAGKLAEEVEAHDRTRKELGSALDRGARVQAALRHVLSRLGEHTSVLRMRETLTALIRARFIAFDGEEDCPVGPEISNRHPSDLCDCPGVFWVVRPEHGAEAARSRPLCAGCNTLVDSLEAHAVAGCPGEKREDWAAPIVIPSTVIPSKPEGWPDHHLFKVTVGEPPPGLKPLADVLSEEREARARGRSYEHAVCVLVQDRLRRALVIQRPDGSGLYGLPGGAEEPTDTSHIYAAARELREETGIDALLSELELVYEGPFDGATCHLYRLKRVLSEAELQAIADGPPRPGEMPMSCTTVELLLNPGMTPFSEFYRAALPHLAEQRVPPDRVPCDCQHGDGFHVFYVGNGRARSSWRCKHLGCECDVGGCDVRAPDGQTRFHLACALTPGHSGDHCDREGRRFSVPEQLALGPRNDLGEEVVS